MKKWNKDNLITIIIRAKYATIHIVEKIKRIEFQNRVGKYDSKFKELIRSAKPESNQDINNNSKIQNSNYIPIN